MAKLAIGRCRILIIPNETWDKLVEIKEKYNLKSVDEVIEFLIDELSKR